MNTIARTCPAWSRFFVSPTHDLGVLQYSARKPKVKKHDIKTVKRSKGKQKQILKGSDFKSEFWNYCLIVLGSLLYAATINLLVIPSGLYIGNLTGIAKIILELIQRVVPGIGSLTGVILLGLNLPLLLISYKSVNRKFMLKTVISIAVTTLALSLIPIRLLIPELDDLLTVCLVGGTLAGFGAGLCLRAGGSSGGTDILGVYISLKHNNFSVGRVGLLISLIVYGYALFANPPLIMVYSVIFTLIYAFMMDRTHYQNVKINVMVISRSREILPFITQEIQRGATYWDGKGAYTDTDFVVINTVVSKYELIRLRRGVLDLDPKAFFIENNAVNVTGYFPSHFF
ncbi:MAG TPA: YitT family protein [Anaerolineaceae bacterium]|nr:YitT family protein [Anaerolineaceae bacterium]